MPLFINTAILLGTMNLGNERVMEIKDKNKQNNRIIGGHVTYINNAYRK